MLFRSATSAAMLACAASAVAKPQPYKLAVMSLPGLSLSRRDTLGYQPEETVCGDGNSCSEACGEGYEQCASNDAAIHCFNPQAAQSCCTDGTGNSCEANYYCTHDSQLQTWCCPDDMDLEECAAAYNVTGGLETPEPTTSEATTTSTTVEEEPTTTSTTSTSITPTTTSTTSTSTTPTPSTTSTPSPTSTPHSKTSSHYSSSWSSAHNNTMTSHTVSKTHTVSVPEDTTGPVATPAPTDAGASASGVSLALLVAAAGFVALF